MPLSPIVPGENRARIAQRCVLRPVAPTDSSSAAASSKLWTQDDTGHWHNLTTLLSWL